MKMTPSFTFDVVVRLVKPNKKAKYHRIKVTDLDLENLMEKSMTDEVLFDFANGWRLNKVYGENYQFVSIYDKVVYYSNETVLDYFQGDDE